MDIRLLCDFGCRYELMQWRHVNCGITYQWVCGCLPTECYGGINYLIFSKIAISICVWFASRRQRVTLHRWKFRASNAGVARVAMVSQRLSNLNISLGRRNDSEIRNSCQSSTSIINQLLISRGDTWVGSFQKVWGNFNKGFYIDEPFNAYKMND